MPCGLKLHIQTIPLEDTSGLAVLLHCPTGLCAILDPSVPTECVVVRKPAYKLIQDLIIPHIQCLTMLTMLKAPWFKLSFWDDSTGQWQLQHFLDVEINQKSLDEVQVKWVWCFETWYYLTMRQLFLFAISLQSVNHSLWPGLYVHSQLVQSSVIAVDAVPVTSLLELETTISNCHSIWMSLFLISWPSVA